MFIHHGITQLAAQTQKPPPPRYETREQHDPNGIGKFYLGREIAYVMGHQAADWLERPERQDEEAPDKLVEALELKPGDQVADIGAGTGYFSWRMARLVGSTGAVYAVDIQQEMLDLLGQKMAERGLKNVKGVHSVEVNYANKKAVVSFDDAQTTVDALTHATADAGYPSAVTK